MTGLDNMRALAAKSPAMVGRVRVANGKCKSLVGERARLVRAIVTYGGTTYARGTLCKVSGTWRGVFHLDFDDGGYVRHVDRSAFTVVG